MSSIVRFKKREIIYGEGDPAEAGFSTRLSQHKKKHLMAGNPSLHSYLQTLFGLSAEAKYTNCTKAITDVTAYRLPVTTLRSCLQRLSLALYRGY
jgi:CRP-like cAMP-binding protein